MSDRVVVMSNGIVAGCLDRAELSQEKIMTSGYVGHVRVIIKFMIMSGGSRYVQLKMQQVAGHKQNFDMLILLSILQFFRENLLY
jgi:hypothetical protein